MSIIPTFEKFKIEGFKIGWSMGIGYALDVLREEQNKLSDTLITAIMKSLTAEEVEKRIALYNSGGTPDND